MSQQPDGRTVVMITSPLEDELAQQIREAEPDRIELIHRPDLLFPARYPTDHYAPPGWTRSPEDEQTWRAPSETSRSDLGLPDRLRRWTVRPQSESQVGADDVGRRGANGEKTRRPGFRPDRDNRQRRPQRAIERVRIRGVLFHAKQFQALQERQRAHKWVKFCGGEINGQTIAIFGPGRIGRQIAKNARSFGMTVWAMARTNDPERAAELGVDRLFARDQIKEMLAGADAVVLCTPHTPETEGLLGPDEVAAMKHGIVLVNIARGVVIDEAAMIAALKTGQIAFAALDVFNQEPLPETSELWDLPNVLINAHSASNADSENGKITARFIENLHAYLDGRLSDMSPVLDKQRMY